MRSELLNVLACPACRRDLELRVGTKDGARVLSGELTCEGCRAQYPIVDGVPRMLVGAELERTRQGFSRQWRLRFAKKFERHGLLYRHQPDALMRWIFRRCLGDCSEGEWMLDAGCGSGHKAIAAARQNPELHVVGLDLTDTLTLSAKEAADIPNIDFVQGDVMHPPFREGSFNKLLSWGVLHHTRDTREAFVSVNRLLAPAGRMVVWIYPDPSEDALAARYYRIRDRHFFGKGDRIPRSLLLTLVRVYCALMAPFHLYFYLHEFVPRYQDCGYVRLGRSGLYRSMVFTVYDNLVPEFQFRHKRSEVMGWFEELGNRDVATDNMGHYWGERA